LSAQTNKRRFPRRAIKVDLTQALATENSDEPIRCLAVDLSRRGLGVVGFAPFMRGTSLRLNLREKSIVLEIIWTCEDPLRSGIYRAGFAPRDPTVDLVKAFWVGRMI
jgi:hypothetical protein